jgi:carbonic anhydrase/acetyltransferase-like protein (isoleucine patch superfamily)
MAAASIHPTALVDPSARIGANVEIGAYSIVGAGVELGDGSRIGPHCTIEGPTRIGRDNRFHGHAAIGGDPQDKKFEGERTELVIGDRNVFREFTTINRGTGQGGGATRIGDDNWLLAYVHVAHDCRIGNGCVFSNNATLAGHVEIGDFVILSGFAGVHQPGAEHVARGFAGDQCETERTICVVVHAPHPPSAPCPRDGGERERIFTAAAAVRRVRRNRAVRARRRCPARAPRAAASLRRASPRRRTARGRRA